MRSTRQSGDCYYMFQSGSKYYLWNQIADEIWGDCNVDGPGRYYNGDRQAEIRIAGD
jgi:hypothetical protein